MAFLDDPVKRMMLIQTLQNIGNRFSDRPVNNNMMQQAMAMQMRKAQEKQRQKGFEATLQRASTGRPASTTTRPSQHPGGALPNMTVTVPGQEPLVSSQQADLLRGLFEHDPSGAFGLLAKQGFKKSGTSKLIEAFDKQTLQTRLVPESEVYKNPERYALDEPKAAGPTLGKNQTGYALQQINRLTEKAQTQPLTPAEENILSAAHQIIAREEKTVTPEATYIRPGITLPGQKTAQAAPAVTPKAITGEQAMRVSMLSQSSQGLDELIGALKNSDGSLNRALATELRTGAYLSPESRIFGPQLERTREAFLRALTGAAAPEPEVKRVKNLLTPTAWDIAAGDYAAVENKLREAQQIFNRYVDITAPGRGLTSEPAAPQAAPSTQKRLKYNPNTGLLE